jgi:hypothetical protein
VYLKNKLSRIEIVPLEKMSTQFWIDLPCESKEEYYLDRTVQRSPVMIENVALTKEDIQKYLKLLRFLIDVKCGTGKAIKTVATSDDEVGEIIRRLYECLKDRDLATFSNLTLDLSGFVKINHQNEYVFKK